MSLLLLSLLLVGVVLEVVVVVVVVVLLLLLLLLTLLIIIIDIIILTMKDQLALHVRDDAYHGRLRRPLAEDLDRTTTTDCYYYS